MKKAKKLKKLIEKQNKILFTHLDMQHDQNKYLVEAIMENQSYNYFMMKTIVNTNKLLKNS